MKPVRLTFWSVKGGVGKTTLALNFAFHFDCGIITNERYTMLDKILPNEKFLKLTVEQQVPHIPEEHGIIFDMGGFLDKRVKQAIEQSDYTIIPTTSDKLDMQGAISTIGEIKDITKNIIVVVNKVEKDEDFEEARNLLSQMGNYPIFDIRKSRALKNIVDEKKSIIQFQQEGGLMGYTLRSLAEQFERLTNFITN